MALMRAYFEDAIEEGAIKENELYFEYLITD
jgi:hypothetical protein